MFFVPFLIPDFLFLRKREYSTATPLFLLGLLGFFLHSRPIKKHTIMIPTYMKLFKQRKIQANFGMGVS